jgi:hypothetical protein
MTGRATFGDFAATATRHLRNLHEHATGSAASPPQTGAEIVGGVRALLHAMAGYADDACVIFDSANPADRNEIGPWIRAASQTRRALSAACDSLQRSPLADLQPERDWPADARTGGLHAAALSMTLGRDLLHTHLDIRSNEIAQERSEWAPVIQSPQVARAILHHVGQWSRRTVPHVSQATWRASGQDRQELNAACQGLFAASCAVAIAQEQRRARDDELRLLDSIPVNAQPVAVDPGAAEPTAGLCNGVISTAERLRFAARRAIAQAARSPELTRESLRQTAGCCAVTASNLQILLSTLGAHHGRPCAPFSASIADAATAADRARAAWLRVAEAWDSITTDTRGNLNQTATEAASLALWTGRLAYADPNWTLVLGPRHQPRRSADLAADHDQLRQVVDAAHYSCHTLAAVAESEQRQVRTASMTRRLIVPTRSLPASFDVPYRFAPAPGTRTEPLLTSYNLALKASAEATATIGNVAAEVKAPTRLLVAARVAVRPSPTTSEQIGIVGFRHGLTGSDRAQREHAAAMVHGEPPQPQPLPPGPVERILIDLDVTTPADLKRAAELDGAAEQLILRAARGARPSPWARDPNRSAGSAEVINHLLITTDSDAPAVLAPGQHRRESPARSRDLAHHATARQLEAEAGA